MAIQDAYQLNEKHKNTGYIVSLIAHILVIIILLMPLLIREPVNEAEGILLVFGDPDAGYMNELPTAPEPSLTKPLESNSNNSPSESIVSKAKEDVAPVKATDNKKTTTPNANDAITKAKKAEDDAKKQLELERKNREAAERAIAEKEAADRANQKKKYSDLFGKGQGTNGTPGNQGSEKGSPDGKALEGISKGSGRIGGGLNGRGVEYEPSFTDNSQKTGRVTLSICVNNQGNVSKAEFTQKGSTTSDPYLIELARKSALRYKFTKSDIETQCGTVTIDFKVR
jgi:hypothetical protein